MRWLSAVVCLLAMTVAGCDGRGTAQQADSSDLQLTVQVTGPGTASPALLTLKEGEQGSVAVQAEPGFYIASMTGCSGELEQAVFTTAPMTANCTLVVVVEPKIIAPAERVSLVNPGQGPVIGSQSTLGRSSLTLGGVTYFTANDGVHGQELWRTDGTPEGTRMVKDIHPGAGGSLPISLVSYQDRVCFGADDGINGASLWCSDGTATGTVRLPLPGAEVLRGRPQPVAVYQGSLYVVVSSVPYGAELWRTDGTEQGTQMVRDIEPGPVGSNPWSFAVSTHGLLFFAENATHGRELWRSDGTPGGTVLLKDIAPGPASGVFASPLVEHQGWYYFTADDGVHGPELWRTNGTAAGTTMVANLGDSEGSNPNAIRSTPLGLMFIADAGTGDGIHLWRLHPTTGEPEAVTDALVSPLWGLWSVPEHSDWVYFVGPNFALWRTNGVDGGAELLGRTRPEAETDFVEIQGVHDGALYFTANSTDHGNQLFRWTGTGSLERLTDFGQVGGLSLSGLASNGSVMLFRARHPDVGEEVWRLSEGEVTLLSNIAPEAGTSWPRPQAKLADRLLFSAFREDSGRELWITAANEPTSTLVLDAEPGPDSGIRQQDSQHHLAQWFDDRLYYIGFQSGSGEELWRTDGTASGTVLVSDACTETVFCGGMSNTARAGSIMPALSDLYFFARSSAFAAPVLRRVTSTPVGSDVVSPELLTVAQFQFARPWAVIDGTLYLAAASHPLTGFELWRVAPGGVASVVREIQPGGHSHPDWLTHIAEHLFFVATEDASGRELWLSDGTFAGTIQVADIFPGAESSNPYHLTAHQGVLYFTAFEPESGRELWRSDGTVTGTYRVKDLYPGPGSSDPFGLTSTSLGLIFAARHPEGGVQVWLSDGTEAGTHPLANSSQRLLVPSAFWIRPEGEAQAGYYQMDSQNVPFVADVAIYNRPFEVVELNEGRAVFRACNEDGLCPLWLTWGTAASTRVVSGPEMNPHADPGHLMIIGDDLYFTATDTAGQRGLWRWPYQ